MLNSNEEIKTAEQQLEDLHNRMLIMDQNYDRVKRLHDSEKENIRVLQNFKADLESDTKKLSEQKDELNLNIIDLENKKSTLNTEIESSENNLSKINEDIAQKLTGIIERERILEEKEQDHNFRSAALSKHGSVLDQWNSELRQKHDKITAFKESL